jgi:hypothetical protein
LGEGLFCEYFALQFSLNKSYIGSGYGDVLAATSTDYSITNIRSVIRIMLLCSIHYCSVVVCADNLNLVLCKVSEEFLRSMFKPSIDNLQFLFSEHLAFQFRLLSSSDLVCLYLFTVL